MYKQTNAIDHQITGKEATKSISVEYVLFLEFSLLISALAVGVTPRNGTMELLNWT
jgi:hypothetical protein